MAYERGKFGIEFNPVKPEPDRPWLLWALGIVFLVAFISLVITVTNRVRRHMRDDAAVRAVEIAKEAPNSAINPPRSTPQSTAANPPRESAAAPKPPAFDADDLSRRPVKVRNLLMRLEKAEVERDIEMAISTIEQLRSLPGAPAADLDDKLARRLGVLNIRRLFTLKSNQWVVDETVQRGDSASRIAYERGSTFASLRKLNPNLNLDKLKVGQTLKVMDHPRFNLVIRRRTRIADLSLNGKFFKRYYLTDDVKGEEGAYETPDRLRTFFQEKGISLSQSDRTELETLIPPKSSALISEL